MSTRARVLAVAGPAGLVSGLVMAGPPKNDAAGLAGTLGEAVGGIVRPEDVRWESSEGTLADLFRGRWALFLASETSGGARDVWRARVRVAPDGSLLGVADAYNLTETPLGDDHALVLRGEHAAFATLAYGQEQSVSLLDLGGDPSADSSDASLADRAMRWLTNVQQTGASRGIGRTEITLDEPALAVGLTLGPEALAIDLADPHGTRHASVDLARAELTGPSPGLHAETTRHLTKRFILWAVDTVRAVPWIGPAPIAWLEERTFAARDTAKQLAFKLHGEDPLDTLADPTTGPAPPPPVALDASQVATDAGRWPPPDLPSIWKTAEPGEGVWREPKLPWMKKARDGAPPPLLRTFVRPDEERPYAEVLLVAMDMRQLDFDMEAGTEDPKPLTGGAGPGHLPRDPQILTRVVAAFNGAFKTEHGNYGMMVHKRVLLPPQPNAASIVVLSDSRVGFGTWANTAEIGGIDGVEGSDIVSFRQNLDPLVDQGQINPVGRALWGYTLPGSGMQTQRSGVCVTGAGNLVYAWGDDVSATALGKAMKTADCVYAVHLDMNPHHTGFIFASVDEIKGHRYHSELLSPLMEISPDRYIEYAPKDFFYVMLRDPTPHVGSTVWTPDAGVQPAPAWSPSLWSARADGGDGGIELLEVEPARASFRIRAGTKEPDAKTGATPTYELAQEDVHRVLFAVGLGVSAPLHPRGLATDGRMVLPLRASTDPGEGSRGHVAEDLPGSAGVLVARADGTLAILHSAEVSSLGPHEDFVELPLLLDEGVLAPGASKVGTAAEHAALGLTKEGRVILARGQSETSVPLAEALRRAGCGLAVGLDRGARAPGFLDRAGAGASPRARYEQTTLYAVAAPMKPRAFRFQAEKR